MILAVALAGPGCATMRPLEDVSPASIQQQLAPGDEVRVAVADGREFELELTRVDAGTLTGVADSGKHLRIRYDAIASLEVAGRRPPIADGPPVTYPVPGAGRGWFGINLGMVAGNVDHIPCTTTASGECSESGVFPAISLNATFVDKNALRLRVIQAQEQDTEHKPVEVAALYGPRLGRSWYALLGVGQIFNPDDDYPGDVTGLAWEFVFAPATPRGAAFELAIYGNTLGDADFVGVACGIRIGGAR